MFQFNIFQQVILIFLSRTKKVFLTTSQVSMIIQMKVYELNHGCFLNDWEVYLMVLRLLWETSMKYFTFMRRQDSVCVIPLR